jgi:hypothetical protein
MASYCLSQDKAWHSLKKESAQHGPKTKVLVCSSSATGQLFFHTCEHRGALVKYGGM